MFVSLALLVGLSWLAVCLWLDRRAARRRLELEARRRPVWLEDELRRRAALAAELAELEQARADGLDWVRQGSAVRRSCEGGR